MHAAIHDLGYKSYVGTRRPQRTRYRVIVKNLMSHAWRGWWRMKIWVGSAAIATVVVGALMYLSKDEIFKALERQGLRLNFADALLPMSFTWYTKIGFILTLTVGAVVVANDLRAGAFEFYFSRPVRPVDYVLGKIGGLFLMMATVLLIGPLLLALFRIGISDTTDELVANLVLVPKTLLVGTVATLAYAVAPLAFSAISARSRHTMAAWAAFYLVAGTIAAAIAHGTDQPDLGAFDIPTAVTGFAFAIFDVSFFGSDRMQPSIEACAAVLALYGAAGVGLVFWRVRRAQRAGMGGG
jgi:ABC-2 type transport system permease protein